MTRASSPDRRRAFRLQYEAIKTLWSDGQTEDLEKEILTALEAEFGPISENAPKEPVQHVVGWLDDNDTQGLVEREAEPLPGWFWGARVCNCLSCGQRIVWKPTAFNVCACSRQCAKRIAASSAAAAESRTRAIREAHLAKEAEKRKQEREQEERARRAAEERLRERKIREAEILEQCKRAYARLVTDIHNDRGLKRIVDSLQLQLEARPKTRAIFTDVRLVRNKWTVLEFSVSTPGWGHDCHVHIVLNGSGPGRAAWTRGAASAEQAVAAVIGHNYSSNVGMPHP